MTRADKILAALKALPPDEADSIRSEVRSWVQSKPRNAEGWTELDEAYISALVIFKDASESGESANAALELATSLNPLAKRHFFSFRKIVLDRNRRDLHTEANRRRGGCCLNSQPDDSNSA